MDRIGIWGCMRAFIEVSRLCTGLMKVFVQELELIDTNIVHRLSASTDGAVLHGNLCKSVSVSSLTRIRVILHANTNAYQHRAKAPVLVASTMHSGFVCRVSHRVLSISLGSDAVRQSGLCLSLNPDVGCRLSLWFRCVCSGALDAGNLRFDSDTYRPQRSNRPCKH